MSLDRRQFLGGAGSIAAAGLLRSRSARAQNRHQVVVIGAGLSGLGTALSLEAEGVDVQVIEGRNRVGGRVLSNRNVAGAPEFGGTSFGVGYARVVDMAKSLDVELVDLTPRVAFFRNRELALDGKVVPASDWPDHPRNPFTGEMREMMPWGFTGAMTRGKNPLKTVDDWVKPEFAEFDIPAHEWFRSAGASESAIDIGFNTNISHGTNAHDVSMLMLFYVDAFTQAQIQLSIPTGVFGYTAKDGNQAIPEAMAAALKHEIHFEQAVAAIHDTSDGAEVHCHDGTVYKADHVVCSVPFAALRNIKLHPMPEGAQGQAIRTLPSQLMNLIHLVPKKPFWEDDGFHAAMYTNSAAGLVLAERKADDPAEISSITCWARGPDAQRLDQLPRKDAEQLVVRALEEIRPAAKGQLEVGGYKSWYLDPFSAGDWAYWKPGQISTFAQKVAEPHGHIHFCGEHTAVSSRGMEGALESAERVALEIFARM